MALLRRRLNGGWKGGGDSMGAGLLSSIAMRLMLLLIVIVATISGSAAQSDAQSCVDAFRGEVTPSKRRPWRSIKDPIERYREYGVMVLPYAPVLTSGHLATIRATLQDTRFNQHSIMRDALTLSQISKLPERYRPTALERRKALLHILDAEILENLHIFVSQLEMRSGLPAEMILIRDETGNAVYDGHRHTPGISEATATVTLEGPGSFVDVDGERYQTARGKTLLFRDGNDPMFHGTPRFTGPRFLVTVVFAGAKYWLFDKSNFKPGTPQPFPNAH